MSTDNTPTDPTTHDRLRALVRLVEPRWATFPGDWACVECAPDSHVLVAGFLCAYHAARAALAQPAAVGGGLREKARLVGQWGDAVDPMPDELRAELRDLYAAAVDLGPGCVDTTAFCGHTCGWPESDPVHRTGPSRHAYAAPTPPAASEAERLRDEMTEEGESLPAMVTVAVVNALMAEEIGAGHYRWQVMNVVRPAIFATFAAARKEGPRE